MPQYFKVVTPERYSYISKVCILHYPVDKVVKPLPKTPGIFCFETQKDAWNFVWSPAFVIKVEGVRRRKQADGNWPRGTILCSSVKVLT